MKVGQFVMAVGLVAVMGSGVQAQVCTPPIVWMPVTGTPLPVGTPVVTPLDNGYATPPYYPNQIQQAYGVNKLLQAGTDGAGQTIAIVDAYHDPTAANDLNYFSSFMGLQVCNSGAGSPTFTQFNQDGGTTVTAGTTGGWTGEESLDIEWAHSMAPKANIILYEANSANMSDLMAAVNAARNNPAVSVVSMSFGSGEYSSETQWDSYFTTPGTRGTSGVTFVASAGDHGAPANYPSASPNVVSVGGTSLTLDTNNNYVSESAWSLAGTRTSAGGGGPSAYEPKPAFQNNVPLLAGSNARGTPDLAFNAWSASSSSTGSATIAPSSSPTPPNPAS